MLYLSFSIDLSFTVLGLVGDAPGELGPHMYWDFLLAAYKTLACSTKRAASVAQTCTKLRTAELSSDAPHTRYR